MVAGGLGPEPDRLGPSGQLFESDRLYFSGEGFDRSLRFPEHGYNRL